MQFFPPPGNALRGVEETLSEKLNKGVATDKTEGLGGNQCDAIGGHARSCH